MATGGVLTRRSGSTLTVTIDRPDANNALRSDTLAALDQALDEARSDPGVRVVVVRGDGRAFSAGADLRELRDSDAETAAAILHRGQEVLRAVEQLGKPVVAAVDGYAVGAGSSLRWPARSSWRASARGSGFPSRGSV
jgi:enoyl-CoA hydratase